MDFAHTASLGAGVIGASWTALFLASGRSVAVYDPAPGAADRLRAYIDTAWPTLDALGMAGNGTPDAVTFCADPAAAVDGAAFVQESVPERLEIKSELYARIEPALAPGAIVSTSASGLMLSELQTAWRDPAPLILGHPFNPPHLIPLVEVMGNDRTAPDAVDRAEAFYKSVGKVTIRVRREVPGHVANRLQAALWREAISLVSEGVASVEDVDKAIWAGPGLRWAAMGPNTLFSLAAGPDGLAAYIDHFKDSFHRWWDDLGDPRFTPEVIAALTEGVSEATQGRSVAEVAADRDALIIAMQLATRDLR